MKEICDAAVSKDICRFMEQYSCRDCTYDVLKYRLGRQLTWDRTSYCTSIEPCWESWDILDDHVITRCVPENELIGSVFQSSIYILVANAKSFS